jgi:hypothetical protein
VTKVSLKPSKKLITYFFFTVPFYNRREDRQIKQNKALHNRLNVEVNHLQFDYRNTCAIINFTHQSCCADSQQAMEICQKIKNKVENIHSNPLEINRIDIIMFCWTVKVFTI